VSLKTFSSAANLQIAAYCEKIIGRMENDKRPPISISMAEEFPTKIYKAS
jgi:hypothetical protein